MLVIEDNHLTLHAALLKYGASVQRLSVWLRMYSEDGIHTLEFFKRRGRPRKNCRPLTELERLQKENQELKREIALLKKSESLSRGEESTSTRDWARAIEELRLEGHPLDFMMERMKMPRSVFYYRLSHLDDGDGYDNLRLLIRTIYDKDKGRYGYRRI